MANEKPMMSVAAERAATRGRRRTIPTAMAASGRFSPWRGLAIGLSVVVLTPEPIGPGDDEILGRVLAGRYRRLRTVPFGLFRLNLGQEAASFALATSADALFPEAEKLADSFSEHFRRFVPFLEV